MRSPEQINYAEQWRNATSEQRGQLKSLTLAVGAGLLLLVFFTGCSVFPAQTRVVTKTVTQICPIHAVHNECGEMPDRERPVTYREMAQEWQQAIAGEACAHTIIQEWEMLWESCHHNFED